MKICFVYPDLIPHRPDWTGYFYTGIALLSSVLKQEGHQTSLVHIFQPIKQSDFIKRIKYENPDLIGFSSTSHMFPMVKKLAFWLLEAKTKVPTICGGIHPTIAPEDAIRIEGLNMICRGEGEPPLVELCRKMENGEDISRIPNLWVKTKQSIIKNPPRRLLVNLDELPFPDWDIFSYQNLFSERQGRAALMAGRGCPYNCSYCCNHLLREFYGNGEKVVRFRRVDKLIAEIEQVLKHYSFIRALAFDDDILFLSRAWSEEFAEKYSQRIKLPFICNARADIIDQAMVDLLKRAGCSHVKFGLESGNGEIRYKVLNRHMTDGQIKRAFTMCKKAGIITESFNMVGIPFETPKAILDTIKLNASIGVDKMQVTIYQPYAGTQLANLCQEHDFLESSDLGPDFFSPSILKLNTVSSAQVLMFRDYFKALVRYYQVLARLPSIISETSIGLSDRILSAVRTAKILNLAYIPLNYLFRRINLLRLRVKVTRSRAIGWLNYIATKDFQ